MEGRNPQFKLPNWRKIPSLKSRGIERELLDLKMSNIVMEAKKDEIKQLLLKVKVGPDYDSNYKTLTGFDVNLLKECLLSLTNEVEGLTKDGLIYKILKALYSMIPHNCYSCKAISCIFHTKTFGMT